MGSKWAWVLGLVFMFLSLEWCLSLGCVEEERVALLQLRHFFNSPYSLQDWVEKNSNCCQWERVECNKSTGRVIQLYLHRTTQGSRKWYLNASMFSVFEELQSLDLLGNSIAGFVEKEGLDKLSRLRNLEYLNLGSNMLNNDILSSLNALSSLKEIHLSVNSLKGTIDLQGIDSHNNLRVLYLDCNYIEKVLFPKGLDKLSRLRNLETLYLGYNKLNNDILSSLKALSSLKFLDLSNNRLNETVNLQGLNVQNNLQYLILSDNEIEKIVFPKDNISFRNLSYLILRNNSIHDGSSLLQSSGSLPSLNYLEFSSNNFSETTITTGDLPNFKNLKWLYISDVTNLNVTFLQIFGLMTSLEDLILSNCGLQGTLSPQENLYNFTSLKYLRLVDSSLHISLLHSIAAFTSLQTLEMQSCQVNATSSFQDLPNFKNLKELSISDTTLSITFLQIIGLTTSLERLTLFNCGLQGTLSPQDGGLLLYHHDLYFVDLSHNNLTGEFPNWLLENNTELRYLHLANNSLGGRFQLPFHPHLNLTFLDISKNFFPGQIPKQIGGYLPSLGYLNLSRNYFDGHIPSSIGDMNSLQVLDISHNNLSGGIPEHLAEGCTHLEMLVLSNNSLHGPIFSTKFNLRSLVILQLEGNNFTGKIPDILANGSSLVGLYLSDNNLSGSIPSWLGNMSTLEDIIMSNNHVEGPIPSDLCQLQNLQILNLEENKISGLLPSCFRSSSIKQIHLSKNRLQGQLKDALYFSSSLETLDLGSNQLHGGIPTWIGMIYNLIYLILSNNNLVGEVPTDLCQLNQLRLIDLSRNNLSGHIPPCFDITSLNENGNLALGTPDLPFRSYYGLIQRKSQIVEFTTKTMSYSYQGKVLTMMYGIDLSCNNLIGPIPPQVGNLTRIRTLNLSHNKLSGSIPQTFSKLKQIESLDLSYNNLSGEIPPQLVELNSLSSFSVAHNNLSGKTPERNAQFITFDENSYEGNPLLCGPPLQKPCDTTGPSSPIPRTSTDNGEDEGFIDMNIFSMSFTGSYITMVLGIAAVLYINPYWRRVWFYLVETWMTSCYYFVVDNLAQKFRR